MEQTRVDRQALVTLDDFEQAARAVMSTGAYEYVASGAASERTLRANREAFEQVQLLPLAMQDVSRIDTRLTLFGKEHEAPLLVAPMGYHRLVHARGELDTAAGANRAGLSVVASSFATVSFAETAAATARAQWFQLYVQVDRGYTRELLARVLAAGCEAVCVTMDNPVNPMRDREARIGFELPPGMTRANLAGFASPAGKALDGAARNAHSASIYNAVRAPDLTWKDVEWLRAACPVPLLLKGVLRASDAREALHCGCDGVIVSNHGGRALDGVPATLTVLPGIVERVGAEMTVLMDGGVRRGTDVLAALALGARAVLVGRPCLYGLAVDGAAGVTRVLRMLRMELESAMGLAGASELAKITGSLLWRG